jgi:hypothetical protein
MLHDLLQSSNKFNDTDNLCINVDENECFQPFKLKNPEDFSETMSKQWAANTLSMLEDFNQDNDLFLPLNSYANKTGMDINQQYPVEP